MLGPGDRIGAYEIVAPIATGGMAALYLARRAGAAGFARHVAIKVVHPHLLQDPPFVQMFVDEALLVTRITDPNVVHVEELGESEHGYFLVMEYVSGHTLMDVLRRLGSQKRRFEIDLSVWITMQIASGLHAAHQATAEDGTPLGIVHRDVSPQNVMLSNRGHVKLIDFGIAKARGRAEHTIIGGLRGKLRYMSPEQAYGHELDARSDVYSLGIVLWEMLTMRRLFYAESSPVLLDVVRAPRVVPPSQYEKGIPAALDRAVMHALAPAPDDRPSSAREFRTMLVEACPSALRIEGARVATLLSLVMGDGKTSTSEPAPPLRPPRPGSSRPPALYSVPPPAVKPPPLPMLDLPESGIDANMSPVNADEVLRTLTAPLVEIPVDIAPPPVLAPSISANATQRLAPVRNPARALAGLVGISVAIVFLLLGVIVVPRFLRDRAPTAAASPAAARQSQPPVALPARSPLRAPTPPAVAAPVEPTSAPQTLQLAGAAPSAAVPAPARSGVDALPGASPSARPHRRPRVGRAFADLPNW